MDGEGGGRRFAGLRLRLQHVFIGDVSQDMALHLPKLFVLSRRFQLEVTIDSQSRAAEVGHVARSGPTSVRPLENLTAEQHHRWILGNVTADGSQLGERLRLTRDGSILATSVGRPPKRTSRTKTSDQLPLVQAPIEPAKLFEGYRSNHWRSGSWESLNVGKLIITSAVGWLAPGLYTPFISTVIYSIKRCHDNSHHKIACLFYHCGLGDCGLLRKKAVLRIFGAHFLLKMSRGDPLGV